MIEATATDLVRSVRDYLDKVQRGETVQIRRNGKAIAKLIPDSDFMSGKEAARLFASYEAGEDDKRAADAVEDQTSELSD